MFWVDDKVETVETNEHFSKSIFFKAFFNSLYLSPISVHEEYEEGALDTCNISNEDLQLKAHADLRTFEEVLYK